MIDQIIEIVENALQLSAGTVNADSKMEDFAEWDSLAQVIIIGEIAERLGVDIPLDEAADLTSVKALAGKVEA